MSKRDNLETLNHAAYRKVFWDWLKKFEETNNTEETKK